MARVPGSYTARLAGRVWMRSPVCLREHLCVYTACVCIRHHVDTHANTRGAACFSTLGLRTPACKAKVPACKRRAYLCKPRASVSAQTRAHVRHFQLFAHDVALKCAPGKTSNTRKWTMVECPAVHFGRKRQMFLNAFVLLHVCFCACTCMHVLDKKLREVWRLTGLLDWRYRKAALWWTSKLFPYRTSTLANILNQARRTVYCSRAHMQNYTKKAEKWP